MVSGIKRYLRTVVERIKGQFHVKNMTLPAKLEEDLIAYSAEGYEIRIYCQKQHYQRLYFRWFIPNENYYHYHVYGVVTNDAPKKLKEASAFDIQVPLKQYLYTTPCQYDFLGLCKCGSKAIRIYLDALIHRLENHDKTALAV